MFCTLYNHLNWKPVVNATCLSQNCVRVIKTSFFSRNLRKRICDIVTNHALYVACQKDVYELAVNTIPFVEIHGILLMLLNTCVHANLILFPTIGLLLLPSWYKKHFNGVFNFIDVHNIFNRRTDLHTISLMTCYCCFSPVGPFRLQEANLPI